MLQKKCEKQLPQLDHVDPQTELERFRAKYKKKNNKLLDNYIDMISQQQKDYFPAEDIDQQTLEILSKQQIFSARFFFLLFYFHPEDKKNLVQKFFCDQNNIFKQAKNLFKNRQYLNRFLADIGYLSKKQTNLTLRQEYHIQNYKFYSGKGIQKLHEKEGDYDFLQDKHDYIQWMFPNHFQSMFNSHSYPMSYLEVKYFRKSKILGEKLFKSIQIFFDFMGIELLKNFNIKVVSVKRLEEALLINCHNHLRLRRILACLSITGFRLVALRLIEFLQLLISENGRFSRLSYVFKRQWEIYGDTQKQKALELCFHPDDDFPESHKVLLNFINPKDIRQLKIINSQEIKQINKKTHTKNLYNFDSEQDEEEPLKNKNSSNKQDKMPKIEIQYKKGTHEDIDKIKIEAKQIKEQDSEMKEQKLQEAKVENTNQSKEAM